MKKQIFLVFLLICLQLQAFNLTPTFFEKRIDGGGEYQEFVFKNDTDRTARYKISFLPGLGKFGNMSEWINYSPKILTIKPKSQGVLKVHIKAPNGTKEGEYSALLNAKTLPVPKLDRSPDEIVSAAANIGIDVSLEIVSYVGDLKADLEITNLKVIEDKDKKGFVTFNLKSKTPKRGVYYTVEVLEGNENFESTEKGRILSGETEQIKIPLERIKKKDVVGVRIRESATRKELVNKKI